MNRYEVGEEISAGIIILKILSSKNESGFGEIYLAMDVKMSIPFAIKTLQKELISLKDFEDIKKEILPWVDVSDHPNIVTAFTLEHDKNKRPYIEMEPIFPDNCGRKTLADFMGCKEISEEQILKWCIQFCYAMDYVNQKGYVHSDIKPDNILIDNGAIKITDFGLVKPINDLSKQYYGSQYYLAPESWEGTKNIPSEIYSFGIVMYQLVNGGKLPSDNCPGIDLEYFHKHIEIPKFDSIFYPLISKCLKKDSKERYQSFVELNGDLIKILKDKYNQKIEKPKLRNRGTTYYYIKGNLFSKLKDLVNCKKYYELALENSQDKYIQFSYALDLMYLNQFEDALPHLLNLSENPDYLSIARIYFNIGRCYHEEICLYKSIEYYKKAIEINPNYLEAHVNLGNVFKDFGFFEEALYHYEFVLKKDETFQEALLNIVDLYEKLQDKECYDYYFSKLINQPNTPLTNFHIGLFSKKEDLLTFLNSMSYASKEHTFQISALIQLFEFHLKNKNLSFANDLFEEIYGLSKNSIDLMMELCFSYSKQGFIEEAISKIDFVLDYSSNNDWNFILYKKSILIKDYNLKEAIDICRMLLKENEDNEFKSKLYVNLGNFYKCICFEKSLEYFLKASNLDPKNVTSLLNLGMYHAMKEDFRVAELYVDQALEIDNWNERLLINKGNLCKDQLKFEEAIVYFNKYIKLNPTSEVYGYIAYCFHELNDLLEAIFYLRLAINICEDKSFKWMLMLVYLYYYVEFYCFDDGCV